jgi:nucleoside-triphosphatase THEP1
MDVFEIKDRIVIDEVKMMNNTPEQIIEECLKTMAQDKLIIKVKDGVFKKL